MEVVVAGRAEGSCQRDKAKDPTPPTQHVNRAKPSTRRCTSKTTEGLGTLARSAKQRDQIRQSTGRKLRRKRVSETNSGG